MSAEQTPPAGSLDELVGRRFEGWDYCGRRTQWRILTNPIVSALREPFVWAQPIGEFRMDGTIRVLSNRTRTPKPWSVADLPELEPQNAADHRLPPETKL